MSVLIWFSFITYFELTYLILGKSLNEEITNSIISYKKNKLKHWNALTARILAVFRHNLMEGRVLHKGACVAVACGGALLRIQDQIIRTRCLILDSEGVYRIYITYFNFPVQLLLKIEWNYCKYFGRYFDHKLHILTCL